MAKILINGCNEVDGKMSVNRTRESENKIVIRGQIATEVYIEEISTIETKRYTITGVDVFSEAFGSEDDTIIYTFSAEELEVKYEVLEVVDNE